MGRSSGSRNGGTSAAVVETVSNGRRFIQVRLPWQGALERSVRVHRLMLIVGNPGAGKTTAAWASARSLTGRDPCVLQGGPSVDIGSFWGRWTIVGGSTVFAPGPMHIALAEARVLVIEELQAIPVEVLAEVLGVRGHMSVENPITREVLEVPATFRIVATANHESLQCRRHGAILQAFVDDFMVHVVPDPDRAGLRAMLEAHFQKAPATVLDTAIARWAEYHQLAKDRKNAASRFSVRAAMHLVQRLLDGEDEHTAVDVCLVGKYVFDADLHSTAKLRLDVAQ